MSVLAKIRVSGTAAIAAIFAMSGTCAFAQQADEVTEEEEAEPIEEIIVVAPQPGGRRKLDKAYEDPMRARLLKELYEMQETDKEMAWRDDAAKSGRVKLGYDPRDDYRDPSEPDTTLGPDSDQTKPATLFKLEF